MKFHDTYENNKFRVAASFLNEDDVDKTLKDIERMKNKSPGSFEGYLMASIVHYLRRGDLNSARKEMSQVKMHLDNNCMNPKVCLSQIAYLFEAIFEMEEVEPNHFTALEMINRYLELSGDDIFGIYVRYKIFFELWRETDNQSYLTQTITSLEYLLKILAECTDTNIYIFKILRVIVENDPAFAMNCIKITERQKILKMIGMSDDLHTDTIEEDLSALFLFDLDEIKAEAIYILTICHCENYDDEDLAQLKKILCYVEQFTTLVSSTENLEQYACLEAIRCEVMLELYGLTRDSNWIIKAQNTITELIDINTNHEIDLSELIDALQSGFDERLTEEKT